MTDQENSLAQKLFDAWKNNAPLNMDECADILNDFGAAYRVQERVAALKGEGTGGYKISLTSEQTQRMFGTNEPLYGENIPSHVLPSPCTLSLTDMNEPLIEVELAMTAKEDLTTGLSDEELLSRVTIAGDIEVPDARFKAWFPKLNKYLVVADCAVSGYILTGEAIDGANLSVADLADIHVELTLDGAPLRSGDATEVLGNPINALQWLLKALARHGRELKAGTTVSTGTFFVPPKLVAGRYEATFSGALNQTVTLIVED